MNVSEQLLSILTGVGVRNIHGVTGDALNHLVGAIQKQKQIQWRGYKYEGNAAFAAFGESQTTGTLGVCAGTVGPGALHLINGLYNSKKARTPVIAITGQVDVKYIGTNYFQEVDLVKVFDDVCTYQAIVRSPEEAPLVMQKAIQIAINQRTACRIELPSDIAGMKAVNHEFLHPIVISDAILHPGPSSIESAVKAIDNAKRISIFAGDGCRSTRDEVIRLSQKLKAPIVHTLKGSDIFDADAPNVVGLTGLIGNPSGYKALTQCDLIIMLATDFPYRGFLPPETMTIQVDVRAENIGNRTSVDIGVHSDIGAFVNTIMPLIHEKEDSDFLNKLTDQYKKFRKILKHEASQDQDRVPLNPQIFFNLIDKHASDNAVFAVETGTSAIWAVNHISYHSDRRLIGSFNHGSMAVGMPAAMGAQFGFPQREVWALSGDGAFNMVMNDFITAVRYNLPIKVLVLNNSQLAFVKFEMEEAGLLPDLDVLYEQNIDFAQYAKLCGGDGTRVEHSSEIENAILQAKQSSKPFIIDAIVNPGEVYIPPHISTELGANITISKLRELWQVASGNKDQYDDLKNELDSIL